MDDLRRSAAMVGPEPVRLSTGDKIRLLMRIWKCFLAVKLRSRREPLPRFVAKFGQPRQTTSRRIAPRRLSNAVPIALHIGPWRPTCLMNALVLYRLLREQGDPAELVIGLPDGAADHRGHAWVELETIDLGPFPGQHNHVELARFS